MIEIIAAILLGMIIQHWMTVLQHNFFILQFLREEKNQY